MTTITVGFLSFGCRVTRFAYSSISIDLPDPCVCHTTPALPLVSTACTVDPTALVTAKYWCGFAMRLASPSEFSSNAVKLRTSCRNRSWLNKPPNASSIGSTDTPFSIRGCVCGAPPSTFQGAK